MPTVSRYLIGYSDEEKSQPVFIIESINFHFRHGPLRHRAQQRKTQAPDVKTRWSLTLAQNQASWRRRQECEVTPIFDVLGIGCRIASLCAAIPTRKRCASVLMIEQARGGPASYSHYRPPQLSELNFRRHRRRPVPLIDSGQRASPVSL